MKNNGEVFQGNNVDLNPGYGSLNAKPGGKLAVENPPAINRESKKASFSGSIYGHETAPVVDREAKRNSFKGKSYSLLLYLLYFFP